METHSITWRGIVVDITFTPNWLKLADHIEPRSGDRTPLPVTETGYRSRFVETGTIEAHGGPVAFVTAWLDHAAQAGGWSGAQLSLF